MQILNVADGLHGVNAHPGTRGGIGGDDCHCQHYKGNAENYKPFDGLNFIQE